MIHIDLHDRKDNYELVITGHSGYREVGSDIVCSAVSTLRLTLDYRLGSEGVLKSGEGFIKVDKTDRDALVLLQAITMSFQHIADSYPKHVRFAYDGKNIHNISRSHIKS